MLPRISTDTRDTHRYHYSLQLKGTVEDKHTTNFHGWFWSTHFTFLYSFNKTLRRITRIAEQCIILFCFLNLTFSHLHFTKIFFISIKDFRQCWWHLYIIAATTGFTSVVTIIKTHPETSPQTEYWGNLYSWTGSHLDISQEIKEIC